MKTMLTNFLSVARSYKGTLVMNVVGLAMAFAAFLVIMESSDVVGEGFRKE